MISHPAYDIEPWCLRETELNLGLLAQSESVFALSNGHVGWRGNLDEGEPHGLPGTYLNGVYELRPLPYAEAGYGYPASGQSVIDVTNGKLIRLLVDDEPFDLRYGRLHHHQRVLDFRTGLLHRTVAWTSPAGSTVRIRSSRLVSFTQRAVAAVAYEVEPVDAEIRIVLQSELVANEQLPPVPGGDPRSAAALESPLVPEENFARDTRLRLIHRTAGSGLQVAVAADHVVEAPAGTTTSAESTENLSRLTLTTHLHPGQTLRVEKFVAHGWSSTRSLPALHDQVEAALFSATHTAWDGLRAEQHTYLAAFWAGADVEVDGDAEIQQAVRFALFHVLQAGARAEERAIPAKGLTGPGYDGHCFWDTETFVLPLLTYTAPQAAAQALRWRFATLPAAQERARQLGLAGAAFPWRTINGSECSSYWPAGTAAFHINADIADAVVRYVAATDDDAFAREAGVPLLVQTARLWRALGHHDPQGAFHIDGVTGPDEYSALSDDNTYTNLMAQQNLAAAAHLVSRYPREAGLLAVSGAETASWRNAAARMSVPYSTALGMYEQSAGSTSHEVWDFPATGPEQYPLMLCFPYFDLYRKQVLKQADLVLALHLRGDAFTRDDKARAFAYYEALTVRDSSLSACTQAVLAAETGHVELAYDYLGEAAMMDLSDLEHNTRDGLHIASLAGTWTALVAGFGGMRHHEGLLSFAPRLPTALSRLAFTVLVHGRALRVEVTRRTATYSVPAGEPLEIQHYGTPLKVSPLSPRSVTLPTAAPEGTAPDQPPGRRPLRRSAGGAPPVG
ncbi:glycoside hydrolase family 65 protein [Streptomyces sp. NPDC087440]|uniref:glycoside hydrolase family 65 protein n=1 Tax=Streptomyces sp. NPDC087440 TaxID=3365790 RepID=UPI003804E51A